ncbi:MULTISPECIES: iron ABC transporter permease [unclassified Marivivens]|jgi:iron(III) transport system permease protein|uniref:ABC transporter permease n=1 Tax=unclassified Marivivens TaxID=2622455 RepID=UPI0007FB8F66|nr:MULTISPECIES: iron ABC transporter permease [unclassified Marivivens]APO86201.1 iron ABC transporter permease [Marivivens sp. JLT3646]MCL7405297.1 iron ABC transporter permease [Marivivens geojensis]OBR38191.1 iron ABC transporter permease [Donghicola sp. JL3646]
MSEQTSQISATAKRRHLIDRWSVGALIIAALVLLPILAVVWFAVTPTDNIWPHLLRTTLPRYLSNTLILMGSVGVITAAVGAGAAWLVVMYRFPGRQWLQWALLMPLAVPAYVGAYALVDLLEYAGPVQTTLRELFGWTRPTDYWFPAIRTRWAAVLVLSASLYPYVYLLARAAFREQSGAGYEVARALGVGPLGRFWRVGLPLARPAIAAGCAVAMMETVNDFGTVDYFAVQTLTTGIFTTWLQGGNLGGAAQISILVLGLIVLLVTLEKISRRRSRFFTSARGQRPVEAVALTGFGKWIATLACLIPLTLGFILPVVVLSSHAFNAGQWVDPGLIRAFTHTLVVGGVAAVLTVIGGVLMVYGVRLSGKSLPRLLMPVTAIGYAAPGAVLGLGILVPLAVFDNKLADGVLALTGWDPGLLLTGTAAALVIAYVVRFFGIAQGAADAALGRVSPSLPMAARSLGQTAGGVLKQIYLPLVRASVGSTLLLVFVDCVKELPATLLLRPFNYNTLATRVHEKASLENLTQAAPAALVITLVGLCAVALLARANR